MCDPLEMAIQGSMDLRANNLDSRIRRMNDDQYKKWLEKEHGKQTFVKRIASLVDDLEGVGLSREIAARTASGYYANRGIGD